MPQLRRVRDLTMTSHLFILPFKIILLLIPLCFVSFAQEGNFTVRYQWANINYTWRSPEEYQNSVQNKSYIPENNAMCGVKVYKDKLFLALPRIRSGTPITLATVSKSDDLITDPLLDPYPSWEMNVGTNCSSIKNIQSMEIDKNGIMWILDGSRYNNVTNCPPKLILLDLNNNGSVVHTYDFPNDICHWEGCFLNDVVIDGDFAYITETSADDPGLIVFSRYENKSWKIRDTTMMPEPDAINFTVNGWPNGKPVPIDGIAISPETDKERIIYYTALTGFNIYGISNTVLKNETLCSGEDWKQHIIHLGKKVGQSDGMVMDKNGTLFYGVLPLNGIATWQKDTPFNTTTLIDQDNSSMHWPDSFGFDEDGYLYVVSNNIHKYFDPNYVTEFNDDIKFRVHIKYTGTTSC